jgi:hypothetical protein
MTVVVMSTGASKLNVLTEVFKVELKGMRREGGGIVREVGLRNDAIVQAHGFICLFAHNGLVTIESLLKLNVDMIRCMINKDAASREHVFILSLALGGEQATLD